VRSRGQGRQASRLVYMPLAQCSPAARRARSNTRHCSSGCKFEPLCSYEHRIFLSEFVHRTDSHGTAVTAPSIRQRPRRSPGAAHCPRRSGRIAHPARPRHIQPRTVRPPPPLTVSRPKRPAILHGTAPHRLAEAELQLALRSSHFAQHAPTAAACTHRGRIRTALQLALHASAACFTPPRRPRCSGINTLATAVCDSRPTCPEPHEPYSVSDHYHSAAGYPIAGIRSPAFSLRGSAVSW